MFQPNLLNVPTRWEEERESAKKAGREAQSHVWYPLSILKGSLPVELGSVEWGRLFVRFPDGRELWWGPFSKTKGAIEWCIRREGWFEI